MSIVFWAWVCVAVLLALGEAVTGDLLVLPWSVGAAVATLLEAVHAPYSLQWIAFAVVSVGLFVAAQRLIIRRR